MIKPNMATMLAFVFSDICVELATLQGQLEDMVSQSFNRITVDGDTSTNGNSTYGNNASVGGTLAVTGNSTLSGSANVIIIPTSDPGVAGAIWNNAGTLSVSAG